MRHCPLCSTGQVELYIGDILIILTIRVTVNMPGEKYLTVVLICVFAL